MAIKINISNIDKAMEQLKDYQKSLWEKQHELLERLAQIGIDVAAARFGSAQYDGVNDVVVNGSPEWIDENRLAVAASGGAVTFIEFGAGVHYAEQHPKAEELGAVRGEFGQGKGKRDTWGYYGEPGTMGRTIEGRPGLVLTHGNPPAMAMYDAGKEMRNRILEASKEAFCND